MNTTRFGALAAVASILLFGLGVLGPATAVAQDGAGSAVSMAAELPVTRVVLFTSGVGYFEHAGTVTGTQTLELPVGTAEMDDFLQSLVLQDLDGGTIQPVRYPSRDPLGRILEGYSLDLSGDPTLTDLLAQARGEAVRVEASTPLEGSIVNVEQIVTDAQGRQTFLTLSTADGLTRVSLDEVRQIRFQDESVQAELEAALSTLADLRGEETKTVRLAFEGMGERRVRVGYVREMPVWKTTYRLVLDQDGSADLQGWAIFDNPTDMALRDVDLTFVAGQPISFVTNLYEPVYAERPRVEVTTAPSLVPPQYAGEFARLEDRRSREAAESAGFEADTVGLAPQAAPQSAPALRDAGVAAMAQGARTGATFEYRVTTPVTVGRHESAMVPIVNQTIQAHNLAIFDRNVLELRPLRGIRIVNDTGLHLAAGPVTVFDAGGFTGNARISDVLPSESRVLTYAVDLGLAVDSTSSAEPEQITAVRIENGVLQAERRQRIRTTYRVDSSADTARFLVIEHPKRSGFEVVSPEPAPAETPQAYRFGVAVPAAADPSASNGVSDRTEDAATGDREVPMHLACAPGEPCTLEVVLEHVESTQLAIGNITPDQIIYFLENVELSERDRATLDQILDLKQELVQVERDIAEREARLEEITREQSRIRQNMAALDRNSSLYRRYVADLEQQEDVIDAVQSELESLRSERRDLQARLDALIRSLDTQS